tara:strand:- start:1703 stop:1873 length:171 start_codon:yes stop_codon:yes gene_type:complete
MLNDVMSVEVISPAVTTLASGRWISAPSLCESVIVRNPGQATIAVMSTGSNRAIAA